MADIDTYEYQLEIDIINSIKDIIQVMRESNNFHNPTLDELEQRIQ